MVFIPGVMDTLSEVDAHVLDLRDGLDYLKQRNDGVGLLKKIGMNGFNAKSYKHEWTEVELAGRAEAITVTDIATAVDVVDAYIYQIGDLLRCEAEIMRVTALADADTLTVTRAYAGTSNVAHNAKTLLNLGSADVENAAAPAGMQDNPTRLYNYVQTFTRAVNLSNDEIAQAHSEGNPMTGNVKRRFIEWTQKFAQAFFYGVRYEDSSLKIHTMGGLKQFITTNPTSVAGALTLAAIDAEILQIVTAGGDPKIIAMSPYQKLKLDALDVNLQHLQKSQSVAGNFDYQTYQSGVLDHTIDILVDPTILKDELWILDTDYIKIGALNNNGIDGHVHVEDASTPGQDGQKKVIRGKYTMEVCNEKAHSFLYALT